MTDVPAVLSQLLSKRRVFLSEEDFAFSFAHRLALSFPALRLRMGVMPWEFDHGTPVRIMLRGDDLLIPIDVCYRTRHLDVTQNGERIRLPDQRGHELARYDYLKKLERFELLKDCGLYPISEAYTVFLTNDPLYFTPPPDAPGCDAAFHIYRGRTLHGSLDWAPGAPAALTERRESPIFLRGSYDFEWTGVPLAGPAFYFFYTVQRV